ncbi:Ras GTPase [Polyrhizophydium stewartii]|uniref:Ras GTPase n=1 Tax=Polyrhizophydium stewartii TaxID=2732419 RepID=A0ABR4NBM8_9FUNG
MSHRASTYGGREYKASPQAYDPTIEDSYRKTCEIDGEFAVLDVIDTAGQEEYSAMRGASPYFRQGEGIMCVYSVTSRASFEEIEQYYHQIMRVKESDTFPIIIVANKADLFRERVITSAEGHALASRLRCKYIETSAKDRFNVDEAFYALVREVRLRNRPVYEPRHVEAKKRKCLLL